MINLNGNQYKLCLIDTNAISEMVKYPDPILRHFFEIMNPNEYIPCFSLFTILELRKRDDVYKAFLEIFSLLPCFILKSLDQLFQDELNFYPNPNKVTPILVSCPGVLAPVSQKLTDLLNLTFSMTETQKNEKIWNSGKPSILEGMLSLVKNFPPKNSKYTPNEIRSFIKIAGRQQIEFRAHNHAQQIVKEGDSIIVDAFPSIKMTTFNVFYKFYTDQRRPSESDAFDIIISSVIPYVDAVVTEKHQAVIIKKIKQQDKFIGNLEVFRLKDLQ
jgi:hypothetical protein